MRAKKYSVLIGIACGFAAVVAQARQTWRPHRLPRARSSPYRSRRRRRARPPTAPSSTLFPALPTACRSETNRPSSRLKIIRIASRIA